MAGQLPYRPSLGLPRIEAGPVPIVTGGNLAFPRFVIDEFGGNMLYGKAERGLEPNEADLPLVQGQAELPLDFGVYAHLVAAWRPTHLKEAILFRAAYFLPIQPDHGIRRAHQQTAAKPLVCGPAKENPAVVLSHWWQRCLHCAVSWAETARHEHGRARDW